MGGSLDTKKHMMEVLQDILNLAAFLIAECAATWCAVWWPMWPCAMLFHRQRFADEGHGLTGYESTPAALVNINIWGLPSMGIPQYGRFTTENPIKHGCWLGVPHDLGSLHINIWKTWPIANDHNWGCSTYPSKWWWLRDVANGINWIWHRMFWLVDRLIICDSDARSSLLKGSGRRILDKIGCFQKKTPEDPRPHGTAMYPPFLASHIAVAHRFIDLIPSHSMPYQSFGFHQRSNKLGHMCVYSFLTYFEL